MSCLIILTVRNDTVLLAVLLISSINFDDIISTIN